MKTFLSMIFLILLLIGCSNRTGQFDFSQLVKQLEEVNMNFTVINNDEMDHFFSVVPKVIQVEGEYILIYEYPSYEDMEREASTIHGDGNIGNASISYFSTPHYFKKGNIIVQYAGKNELILKYLEGIFGKQFAGR
ncbi:hypothetical protein AWH56_018340 [Anaerobacillus isosaccharinicus]|uniref:Lipoprotein n=1 Tax=Anaerobacillus isosaccharinicus TaxID=1532552 RepID=A0A1S2M8W0_9BACI|nr:hypothetical protein [Anaerobacillus isosaccharinicus]MBA5587135.1 hypothetical protein [Anaerobacillus isosaccharinicus]QOY34668.1 hypothetical protein AWH56_018340 [Anaerobacillus isosaccharinicus]